MFHFKITPPYMATRSFLKLLPELKSVPDSIRARVSVVLDVTNLIKATLTDHRPV